MHFDVRVIGFILLLSFSSLPSFYHSFGGSPCFNICTNLRKRALCCIQLGWGMNKSFHGRSLLFFFSDRGRGSSQPHSELDWAPYCMIEIISGGKCRLGIGCVFFLHVLNSQWCSVLNTTVLSFLYFINLPLCLFKGTQRKWLRIQNLFANPDFHEALTQRCFIFCHYFKS